MGLLFVMKTWNGVYEVWMRRMMDALADDITLIAAREPVEDTWQGHVPVVALPASQRSLITGVAKRLGLPRWSMPMGHASRKMFQACSLPSVDRILVHYLDIAVSFDDVWRRIQKPVFVHCHGYDFNWDQRSHEEPHRPRFSPDYRDKACQLAERATLIANSQWTRSKLMDAGIPGDRIVVKYFGVPVQTSAPQHQATDNFVTVLYLGRLVDFKGPDLVIRAFESACDRGLNGRLVMAGDGPLRATCDLLRARSPYQDRIELVGAVDASQADRLRAEADIFTAHNCHGPLSHQEEAFGVSIIEAMAAGLPVVTGNTSALSESVLDGETGFLIEPGNIEAHAAALLKLAGDPQLRVQMGTAGHSRVRENFTEDQERAQLRSILGLSPKNDR